MKNNLINKKVIEEISMALDDINDRAVYVGGAVVGIYADDPAADDVRPTKDLDLTLEIVSLSDLESLRTSLASKGFYPSPEEKVICRFKYKDILVDFMATKEIGWAPSNEWFAPGFKLLQTVKIGDVEIRILSVAYFLASKFAAFHDRGNDPRTSQDFEDIVYILDNRINLVEEIKNSPEDVLSFLKREFNDMLVRQDLRESILAHLYYETQMERFAKIEGKIKAIIA